MYMYVSCPPCLVQGVRSESPRWCGPVSYHGWRAGSREWVELVGRAWWVGGDGWSVHLHCIDDWIESVMTADSLGTQQLVLVLFVTGAGPLNMHGMAWHGCVVWEYGFLLMLSIPACTYMVPTAFNFCLVSPLCMALLHLPCPPPSLPTTYAHLYLQHTYIHMYVRTYVRIQVFDATNTTRERRQIVLDVCMYNCIKVRP